MSRPQLEVADVFRQYGDEFLEKYGASASRAQRRVLERLSACRTSAMGGHVDRCDTCGHTVVSYNSCRDRHCPKCQASASADWLDARRSELLPVPYYHVVFTLAACLRALTLQNKRIVYGLLFRAVSETLLQIAADPKHLGARIGFLAILHTWSQNLLDHPHVHCVVPGGGLSADGSRWIACRDGFFLPVRVLSRVFRGKLVAFLRSAYDEGALRFHGSIEGLRDRKAFEALIRTIYKEESVVYAKPPFGGPKQVLKYLARYTHRVAISNHRLLEMRNGRVTFRWKNYALGGKSGRMTLEATEFIRRFLLHVLPSGFVRIRYYGLLANRYRRSNLDQCRSLLGVPSLSDLDTAELTDGGEGVGTVREPACDENKNRPRCKVCKSGRMMLLCTLRPFEEYPCPGHPPQPGTA